MAKLLSVMLLFCAVILATQPIYSEPLKTSVNETNSGMVILEFTNLNKRIWIVDATSRDIHFLSGGKSSTVKTSGNRITILISSSAYIEVYGAKIHATSTEVCINQIPMGKNLGAVVNKGGKVTIGAFIRTFDR